MRAPDVTGPGKVLTTGAPPSPPLVAELKQSEAEHTQYKERGYQLVGSGPGPSGFWQFRFVEFFFVSFRVIRGSFLDGLGNMINETTRHITNYKAEWRFS